MENLKHKIEAILFSAGKKVTIEEIAKLANTSTSMAQQALNELKKDYSERASSLMLVDEGNAWKIIVKDEFTQIVKKIVTETELSKTIMETLAVIAFRYPIKQSDLIKIRTNKAYDHLRELEEMGYISRQKHGRTKLIKLTQRFFEYFDLPEEKVKEKFRDFESISKAIEEKESEIAAIKEEQLKKAKEEKQKDERIRQEIDLIDEQGHEVPLEVVDEIEETSKPESESKKVNSEPQKDEPTSAVITQQNKELIELKDSKKASVLEVVDEPSEEEIEKERERLAKLKEEEKEEQEEKKEKEKKEKQKKKGVGIGVVLNSEQEDQVNKKVEEILHPKKEQNQQKQKDI